MDESFLYQQIAEDIRRQIISGQLKPGDRLPPIRSMVQKWNCTPGTVQRAYHELTRQGLLASRTGKGTFVQDSIQLPRDAHLRMASLIHRAESFLLEVLTSGYTTEEAQQAVSLAVDRWQTLAPSVRTETEQDLRFSGSHDLAVKWLAEHAASILPGISFQTQFTGSLGGLLSLAQGHANLAGSHLWDPETGDYNDAFIRKIFPGKHMAAITLAHRSLGFIVLPGNPKGISKITDLARPDMTFVNRQSGSGTRVWLDHQLHRAGISEIQVRGYQNSKLNHSEIAETVIAHQADAGIGLEAVSKAYELDFIKLTQERYDLVTHAENLEQPAFVQLRKALLDPGVCASFTGLGGYDCKESGTVRVIG